MKRLLILAGSLTLGISILGVMDCYASVKNVVYSDDFATDTTSTYIWQLKGSSYFYDNLNKWVNYTMSADNELILSKKLDRGLTEGSFEFRFCGTQTWSRSGKVDISLYGDNTSYFFTYSSGTPGTSYQAILEKVADGLSIGSATLSDGRASYSLNEWHTMKLEFSPFALKGYLDGKEVLFLIDMEMRAISVDAIKIRFYHQNGYLDDIMVIDGIGEDIIPPAPVNTLFVSNPTSRALLLTWEATGDDGGTGTATAYDIRYSTSEIITEDAWDSAIKCLNEPKPRTAGSNEHYLITGLTPDTTYYIAMKIYDELMNMSTLSNVTVKRTSKNEPPPALFPSSRIDKTTWRWRCSRQGNEEEEYKWWTAHYDMAIDGQPFGFWKKINPEVRIIRYQIDLTMLRGSGETPPEKENPELQQYCQDTGYEYEDCFLHFYEDTLVNIKGKDYLIPGYGSGTAKTKKEARMPIFVWTDWRWSYYPGYNGLQNYFAQKFYNLVHTELDNSGYCYDGVFTDEHCPLLYLPEIKSGGTILEYMKRKGTELDEAYMKDVATMFAVENAKMGDDKFLIPNTGEYIQERNLQQCLAADGDFKEMMMYTERSKNFKSYYDYSRKLIDAGKIFLACKDVFQIPPAYTAGSYPTKEGRDEIFGIAWYYMMKEDTVYYHFEGGDEKPYSESWIEALEYDIGQPIGTCSIWKTGTDTNGKFYTIYSRDYTKAKILFRPMSRWDYITYDDTTAVTYNLDSSYYPLQADGSLGTPTTEFTFRNAEAAILIPEGYVHKEEKPSPITDLQVFGSSFNFITLRWTAHGEDGNLGTAKGYDLRYATFTITEENWDKACQVEGEPDPKPAGCTDTFDLPLSPDTLYYFGIKASDKEGNISNLSNIAVGTTADIFFPHSPTGLKAKPKDSQVTLTWEPNKENDITGYKVYRATETLSSLYYDDFATDTISGYSWKKTGTASYFYDNAQIIRYTTGNDWGITLTKRLERSITKGSYEFRFYPTAVYPSNGRTYISISSNNNDEYNFMYPSAEIDKACIKKIIKGTTVLSATLPESYNLYFWHTIRIEFSPKRLTGYLDGKEILSINDPEESAISVGTISIRFYQQDGCLDNIYVTEGGSYDLVSDVGNPTSFTDTGLTDGTAYCYAITGYDKAKNESIYSESASATTFSGAHIILRKTCDKKYVTQGGTLTYIITYTNEGSGTATDVSIIEVLPKNCELRIANCESEDVKISYWYNGWQTDSSPSATKIKWLIPQVAPGEMGTTIFTVEVR